MPCHGYCTDRDGDCGVPFSYPTAIVRRSLPRFNRALDAYNTMTELYS